MLSKIKIVLFAWMFFLNEALKHENFLLRTVAKDSKLFLFIGFSGLT